MTFTICKHVHRDGGVFNKYKQKITRDSHYIHSKIPKSPQEIMENNVEKKFDSNLIPELVSHEILEE